MDIYRIPEKTEAIIFDLDNTLYTCEAYTRFQTESPVRRLAETRNLSFEEMDAEIRRCRKDWAEHHGGEEISLGKALTLFGVSVKETAAWREEAYRPEDFLVPDPELRGALALLAEKYALGVYTNSPVSTARRTLSVLDVEDLFPVIAGLDTFGLFKPAETPLRRVAELLGAGIAGCLSVGDRYGIDLALPLALGMGGILVSGARDVYRLPEILGARPCCTY